MNIIEAEDMVKGLPDQVLFQEAQFPSGRIPQYLAVSEVQRRQDMRQRFQAQSQGQQPTVKDQILQGGIGAMGMAPPISTAPPMAPPAPPMPQGAPIGMANGGRVPAGTGRFFGGFGPELLNSPDRLQRMYGSMNPGVDNYAARGSGLNLSDVKEFIKNPDAEKYSDAIASTIAQGAQAQAALNRGLRAPEGGAYGGGGGGGLPYGGPASYAGRDALRDLIDQVNMQQGQQGKPTVTVEEIPQGMAVGGIVPPVVGKISDLAPETSSQPSQSSMPSIGPPRETIIRRAKALIEQGREMDALVLLRQAGISPQEVMNMATGGMTPGGIVYMQEGRTVPSINLTEQGIASLLSQYMAPTEISPEEKAYRDLIARQSQQGMPAVVDYSPLIQQSEAARKEALDEARRQAISETLLQLGSGIAAGDIAGGQQRAAQAVSSAMARGRQEAAAERQYGRQLQMQSAEAQRQNQIAQMNFMRENAKALADIQSGSRKEAETKLGTALNVVTSYTNAALDRASQATIAGRRINADDAQQKELSRRAFLDFVKENFKSIAPKRPEGPGADRKIADYNRELKKAITLAYRMAPAEKFFMTQEEVDAIIRSAIDEIDAAGTPNAPIPNQGSGERPPIGGFDRPQG